MIMEGMLCSANGLSERSRENIWISLGIQLEVTCRMGGPWHILRAGSLLGHSKSARLHCTQHKDRSGVSISRADLGHGECRRREEKTRERRAYELP